MAEFGPSLRGADHIVLTDIYSAGEDVIPDVTVEALADSIRRSVAVPVEVAHDLDDVTSRLARIARPGDVVLTLGAGSIGSIASALVTALENTTSFDEGREAKA